MKNEKIREIMKDKSFLEKLLKAETMEEVQIAFKSKGIDLSLEEVKTIEDIVNVMVDEKSTILFDEDLSKIAGGHIDPPPAGEQPVSQPIEGSPEPQPVVVQPVVSSSPIEPAVADAGGEHKSGWWAGLSRKRKGAVVTGTVGGVAVLGLAYILATYGGYKAINWVKGRNSK